MQQSTFGRKAQYPDDPQPYVPRNVGRLVSRVAGAIVTACGLFFIAMIAFAVVRNVIEDRRQPMAEASQPAAAIAPEVTSVAKPKPVHVEPCGATMAEFSRLNTGMSYDDASRTIGCRGTELSRVDYGDYSTVMYMWEGTGTLIGNMNATFQNGRLIAKAQMGLR